jgi:hypothetical protein
MESIWWVIVWTTLFYTELELLGEDTIQTYQELFPSIDHLNYVGDRLSTMTTEYTFREKYRQPFFASYLRFLRDYLEYAYTELQNDLAPAESRPIYQENFTCFLVTMEEMRSLIGPLGHIRLEAAGDSLP